MNFPDNIRRLADEMTLVRRELHRRPQLGFKETFAHSVISEHLSKWNIPFDTGLAETGIVATITGTRENSDSVIGFRADMDALPLQETVDRPWKSEYENVMHACGHDGHMSILLGAAAYLQKYRDTFAGTIKFVFQPAEEGIGGARRMIADGLFERHRMDAIYALHNWPSMPAGEVGMRVGPIMAASNSFEINMAGRSSHAAMPQLGINAAAMASRVFLGIEDIFNSLALGEPAIITPTQVHSGFAKNIVPEVGQVTGTIRTLSSGSLEFLQSRLHDVIDGVAKLYGGDISIKMNTIGIPTMNDAKETLICAEAARKVFGHNKVNADVDCAMTSEDFGFMLKEVPGTYMWLGQGVPDDDKSPHNLSLHNAGYDFNDNVIGNGIALFSNIAQMRLN
jgi:amidohydrolase